MELARHTSLGITQRYMHLSPDSRRQAIELLDARPTNADRKVGDGEWRMNVQARGTWALLGNIVLR